MTMFRSLPLGSYIIADVIIGVKKVLLAQPFPILCDPMDCSPLDSSVHGISRIKILEWVAISFSRGSSWPRDWTLAYYTAVSLLHCRQILYGPSHQGSQIGGGGGAGCVWNWKESCDTGYGWIDSCGELRQLVEVWCMSVYTLCILIAVGFHWIFALA